MRDCFSGWVRKGSSVLLETHLSGTACLPYCTSSHIRLHFPRECRPFLCLNPLSVPICQADRHYVARYPTWQHKQSRVEERDEGGEQVLDGTHANQSICITPLRCFHKPLISEHITGCVQQRSRDERLCMLPSNINYQLIWLAKSPQSISSDECWIGTEAVKCRIDHLW